MSAYRMPVAGRVAACFPTDLRSDIPHGLVDLSGDTATGRASDAAIAAASSALDAGETHYTDRPGIASLRKAIAVDVGERHGLSLPAENVVVSGGALESTFAAIWVGLHGKQEAALLLPDPANPALSRLGCLAGTDVIPLPTTAREGFRLSAATVESARPGLTSLLLIGLPSPSTGASVMPAELAAIAAIAERRDLTVLLDESLARLVYAGSPKTTLQDAPSLALRTIIVGSFSHDAGLSSWRIGYFAGTNEAFSRMRSLKQALSICSPSVSQYAALGSMPTLAADAALRSEEFARRLDAFAGPIEDAGLRTIRPDAPPFAWVETGDETAAVERLRTAGLTGRPGSTLGSAAAGWMRFTLSRPADELAAAAQLIAGTIGKGR